jgi:hypothetical protein
MSSLGSMYSSNKYRPSSRLTRSARSCRSSRLKMPSYHWLCVCQRRTGSHRRSPQLVFTRRRIRAPHLLRRKPSDSITASWYTMTLPWSEDKPRTTSPNLSRRCPQRSAFPAPRSRRPRQRQAPNRRHSYRDRRGCTEGAAVESWCAFDRSEESVRGQELESALHGCGPI